MGETYARLYSLPERLYTMGAPVVVAAGALLKDNRNGNIIVQLKIQNICSKTIKAVTVKITSIDTVGRTLGEETEYQYLDLNVKRNEFLGQQVPIIVPNEQTRSYSVKVTEAQAQNIRYSKPKVSFQDKSCCNSLIWAAAAESLSHSLNDFLVLFCSKSDCPLIHFLLFPFIFSNSSTQVLIRLFTSSKSKLTVFPSGKKCSLSSAIQATSRKLLHLFNVSWILQNFILRFPLKSSYFVSE